MIYEWINPDGTREWRGPRWELARRRLKRLFVRFPTWGECPHPWFGLAWHDPMRMRRVTVLMPLNVLARWAHSVYWWMLLPPPAVNRKEEQGFAVLRSKTVIELNPPPGSKLPPDGYNVTVTTPDGRDILAGSGVRT